MAFADGYDTDQALADLRRIAQLLAERTDDDNAQDWACDLIQVSDWFASGQFE
jgi:hypothetical protein